MDCSTSTLEFLKMKWLIGSLYNVDNFFGPDSNDGTHKYPQSSNVSQQRFSTSEGILSPAFTELSSIFPKKMLF